MSLNDNPDLREKSFFQHPKLLEFFTKGIRCKETAQTALLVYLNLIEVQHWFDVETCVISDEQCILIKGRKNQKSKYIEYVLPVHSNTRFTTEDMIRSIGFAEKLGCECESVTMAFVDGSSSLMFYKISNGLIPPNKPSNKELMKMKRITEWNEKKGKWKTYTDR